MQCTVCSSRLPITASTSHVRTTVQPPTTPRNPQAAAAFSASRSVYTGRAQPGTNKHPPKSKPAGCKPIALPPSSPAPKPPLSPGRDPPPLHACMLSTRSSTSVYHTAVWTWLCTHSAKGIGTRCSPQSTVRGVRKQGDHSPQSTVREPVLPPVNSMGVETGRALPPVNSMGWAPPPPRPSTVSQNSIPRIPIQNYSIFRSDPRKDSSALEAIGAGDWIY